MTTRKKPAPTDDKLPLWVCILFIAPASLMLWGLTLAMALVIGKESGLTAMLRNLVH